MLENYVITYNLQIFYVDEGDTWKQILMSAASVILSTYHTNKVRNLGQLVFGRDMITPIKKIADWELIHQQKKIFMNYDTNKT